MRKFTREKEIEIISLYKKGYSQKEIAEKFNTFNTSIRRVLLRNNILIRGNDKLQRHCKHNPFKRNDEYSEYFLGLLITDGCIMYKDGRNRINLSLNERDGYLIQEFIKWASPTSKITKIHQKINDSFMWSATISNRESVDFLERAGNFRNKSYHAKLYLPITWSILRGILDGDGGFYKINRDGLKLSICGKSIELIQQIRHFLEKYGFNPKIQLNRGLYYINLYKENEVLSVGKLLYDNAHIFCKRKYERWLAFYESRRANGVNSGKEMAIQP